jgi:CRP-like cAMP-binding protein
MPSDTHGRLVDDAGDLPAVLRQHLFGGAPVDDPDMAAVISHCSLRHLTKGENLLAPGEHCRDAALVLQGCLHTSFTETDGMERVLAFGPEGWWVADIESLLLGHASTLRIAALEPTRVLLVDESLLRQPGSGLAHAAGVIARQMLVTFQRRLIGSLRKSAADRYEAFRELYPDLDRRIPQYQIAAYLGISPEFLSKLRKRAAGRT